MHEKQGNYNAECKFGSLQQGLMRYATRLDEVPNHNQISVNQRNRENHMGKTLFQKEITTKEGRKDSSLRPPKDNFLHPKHRMQLKILQGCKRFSEDVSKSSVVGM